VGTSYQTLLVIGELSAVRDALAAAGVDGLVMPAGTGRTAVIPKEGAHGYVDPAAMARRVSGQAGFPALSNEVSDSDVVLMNTFRDGRRTHEYVSDQGMLVDWFIDDDGTTKFRIGDVEFPADAPHPDGPLGADAAMLAPFGLGPVDLDRLGAALRGEIGGGKRLSAETQHGAILSAMNLDPRGLTTAFRWARIDTLPGAVRINDGHPPDGSTRTIPLVIVTGLPLEADPVEAGQIIADAVKDAAWVLHADVGYLAVVPGAAGAENIESRSRQKLAPAPQRATFFVALHFTPPIYGGENPEDRYVVGAAARAWTRALTSRYGLIYDQAFVAPIAPEPFAVGFGAAQEIRSTRSSA
jgi:hypothetical protein